MAFNTRMPVVLAMACSLTLLLLFCLPFHVVAFLLLLRMVHRAGRIGADLVNGADIATLGDDGVRRELASLELGTLGLFLRFGFFVADSGVLVSRQDLAAFLLLAVGAADLHKLRLRCDLLGDVFANLGLIAAWISALWWNLGKPQVFPAGSSSPPEPERQIPRSDPSRLVWETAAPNERLGLLTGLWFESGAARSTR